MPVRSAPVLAGDRRLTALSRHGEERGLTLVCGPSMGSRPRGVSKLCLPTCRRTRGLPPDKLSGAGRSRREPLVRGGPAAVSLFERARRSVRNPLEHKAPLAVAGARTRQ
jgi:hypothetical protein